MLMNAIVLARIDGRLIHGQVMTAWIGKVNANKIMVIDDAIAQDSLMKNFYRNSVPRNIMIAIFTYEEALNRLKKGFSGNDRVCIVARDPEIYYRLIMDGIELTEIDFGTTLKKEGRKQYSKTLLLSDEEVGMLKELCAKGINVYVQVLAQDAPVSILKYLE